MLIYKIFRGPEWAELQTNGTTSGAPIDLTDGFIHFSTAAQAAETVSRHFAGVDGLMLAAIEADDLGKALKWEESRGGDLFPHLYRDLSLSDIRWAERLPIVAGEHQFPPGLA